MRTIFLKVEVPDNCNQYSVWIDAKDRNWMGRCKHTEIIPPTPLEIDQQFPTYDEEPKENVYRAEGANWAINKMKGE